jgi:hypothetical protein
MKAQTSRRRSLPFDRTSLPVLSELRVLVAGSSTCTFKFRVASSDARSKHKESLCSDVEMQFIVVPLT